jgi:hypothetical protein
LINDNMQDIFIDSKTVRFLSCVGRPNSLQTSSKPCNTFPSDSLWLIELSEFLPRELPHLKFDSQKIEYNTDCHIPLFPHDIFRHNSLLNGKAFIVSTKGRMVYIYDKSFTCSGVFDASAYSEDKYDLKCVGISPDLNYVLITSLSDAYLFDRNFTLLWKFMAPYIDPPDEEGWQRVERSQEKLPQLSRELEILGISSPNSTPDEVKAAFRRLALRYHPDKNPSDSDAHQRFIQIRKAYEALSGEDARNAFIGLPEEEYWEKTVAKYPLEVGGIGLTMKVLRVWEERGYIHGVGFSSDSKFFYLGCHPGKIYKMDLEGNVVAVYVILGNQVNSVIEIQDHLYIVSSYYIYILKDGHFIRSIEIEDRNYKWFEKGFIVINKGSSTVYDLDGNRVATLLFPDEIRYAAFSEGLLLIETLKKGYLFLMNSQDSHDQDR